LKQQILGIERIDDVDLKALRPMWAGERADEDNARRKRSRAEGDKSIATRRPGPRCVPLKVLADTSVDVTSASKIMTQNCFGGRDRSALLQQGSEGVCMSQFVIGLYPDSAAWPEFGRVSHPSVSSTCTRKGPLLTSPPAKSRQSGLFFFSRRTGITSVSGLGSS
jgi:hypothetical protein